MSAPNRVGRFLYPATEPELGLNYAAITPFERFQTSKLHEHWTACCDIACNSAIATPLHYCYDSQYRNSQTTLIPSDGYPNAV